MIPTEFKQAVMMDGMQFIRTITEAYGAEDGMALWDKISSVLDPDIKGQIFFAMITGEYSTKLKLNMTTRPLQTVNAVSIIKAIRTATGLGLKDAKDHYDSMRDGQTVTIDVAPERLQTAKTELRNAGLFIL